MSICSNILDIAKRKIALSAEIERSLLSQRTKQSLARLKSEGKKLGRPVKDDSERKELVKGLRAEGKTIVEIAEITGIPKSTVARLCK